MTVVQAIFVHERLIVGQLDHQQRLDLEQDIEHRRRIAYAGDHIAHVGAYEGVIARLLLGATELDVAIVEDRLAIGQLVAHTQDFYVRRLDGSHGSFTARLDIDRATRLRGRFSTSHLIGATGQTETFGHHRFTMLAFVQRTDLAAAQPTVELRPLFIGWRMHGHGPLPQHDDRREVSPQRCDQFASIAGKRATVAQRAAVSAMNEEEVKHAFAQIIGEPYVPKDWGGETSDLLTARLTIGGDPVVAAFAFKGPALRGPLYPAGMGKRGDQAIRLAGEPADLLVVQHHNAVSGAVRNLLSALARMHGKQFMVIDGETTALILATHSKLPPPEAGDRRQGARRSGAGDR